MRVQSIQPMDCAVVSRTACTNSLIELYNIYTRLQATGGEGVLKPQPKIKLLDRGQQALRLVHHSCPTEKTYVWCIKLRPPAAGQGDLQARHLCSAVWLLP